MGFFRFVFIILYGHTSATNKHQLTNDFYTTGEVPDTYHTAVHPQLKQTKKEESGKKPQQIGKKKAAIWNGKRHKPYRSTLLVITACGTRSHFHRC